MCILRKTLETLVSDEWMAHSDMCWEVRTDEMQDGLRCLKSKQELGFHLEYRKDQAHYINGVYSSINLCTPGLGYWGE